ncbi:MAG: hypothetical protein OXJ36_11385 [bacterium]|nr:hypothetical protein [bacterium]MDE0438981.1 hypothetical protein [bacterium]
MTEVQTVTGPVPADDLGVVMLHEHVLISNQVALYELHGDPSVHELWDADISIEILGALRKGAPNRANLMLDDEERVAEALVDYRDWGGTTVVENSTWGLGGDVRGLRRVSLRSGVNIVATTGFYKQVVHPPWLAAMTVDDIAEFMIRELEEGIEDTGIRAGAIGECACTEPVPHHPEEEKVLRAACRAQIRTGVGFTFHPSIHDPNTGRQAKVGEAYIDLIEEEGADLDRFYLSHCDMTLHDLDYHRRLLARGITLSYDLFGTEGISESAFMSGFAMPTDIERVDAIATLCREGYDRQLVMSQDVGIKIRWKSYGGDGYSFVLQHAVPMLRERGVTESQIRTMTVDNPRRILAGV